MKNFGSELKNGLKKIIVPREFPISSFVSWVYPFQNSKKTKEQWQWKKSIHPCNKQPVLHALNLQRSTKIHKFFFTLKKKIIRLSLSLPPLPPINQTIPPYSLVPRVEAKIESRWESGWERPAIRISYVVTHLNKNTHRGGYGKHYYLNPYANELPCPLRRRGESEMRGWTRFVYARVKRAHKPVRARVPYLLCSCVVGGSREGRRGRQIRATQRNNQCSLRVITLRSSLRPGRLFQGCHTDRAI